MSDEAVAPRRDATLRLRSALDSPLAAPLVAAALIATAFVARALLNRYVLAPWIMVDELQYQQASHSFYSSGHYVFREQPEAIKSIYPALISPAWLAGSTHGAYAAMKTINSALMAAGAIPLYLWARRLVTPWWAVLAVVLYLALPDFAYSGEILTENAYLPATMLALFATAVALERPTLLRQLLALAAIGLAVAVRLQGIVLLVVYPAAIVLLLVLELAVAEARQRKQIVIAKLRSFWPSLALLMLGVAAYAAYQLGRGLTLSSGLGIYSDVTQAHYQLLPALRWIVYHFGELSFAVALVPVSALIVLFGLACRRATAAGDPERAFLAVATAAVVLVVAEVGTFASHYSVRVEERYMFNVFPVLLLALVVFLARDLPRPSRLTAAAVLVPVALLLALPLESLIGTPGFITDTFGLIPLYQLTAKFGVAIGDVRVLVAIGALVMGVLFATLPRSWARVAVPVAVLAFLVICSRGVFSQVRFNSEQTRHAGGLTGDPSWIDDAIGKNQRVEFLYTTDVDVDQHILWQDEFWNHSVRRVFGVTSQDPSIPDVTAPLDPATGRIVPQLPADSPDRDPSYVVAPQNIDVAGKRLASAGLLALYRVKRPLRLATLTSGLTADSWTTPSASYTRYVGARPGTHLVVAVSRPNLSGPPPAMVTVRVGKLGSSNGAPAIVKTWALQSWTLSNGKTHHFRLPLKSGPFQVQLNATPPFVPSEYGLSDTRTLGVQASFGLSR